MSRNIPPEVKIRVLRAVASAKYPAQSLPTIAGNHHLTLDEVRTVVHAHGWPRPESMRKAADILATRLQDGTTHGVEPTGGRHLVDVPVAKLQGDPQNPRTDLGDLTELADSILSIGILQPIIARRDHDHLVVVAGHRRLAAARLVGLDRVPVVLTPIDPDDVLVAMLIENGQRQDLDPIAEARGYAILKAREDLKDHELARKLGKSQSHVSARLALLDLTDEDQAAIRAGTLTLNTGVNRGRVNAGKHRPNARGKASASHLAFDHPLAASAENCCRQLGHSKMTAGRVGGVACGACWEAVIRSDERLQVRRRPQEQEATG